MSRPCLAPLSKPHRFLHRRAGHRAEEHPTGDRHVHCRTLDPLVRRRPPGRVTTRDEGHGPKLPVTKWMQWDTPLWSCWCLGVQSSNILAWTEIQEWTEFLVLFWILDAPFNRSIRERPRPVLFILGMAL